MKKGFFCIEKAKCVICSGCTAVCPQSVISLLDEKTFELSGACTGCKTCEIFCPMGALRIEGGGKLTVRFN